MSLQSIFVSQKKLQERLNGWNWSQCRQHKIVAESEHCDQSHQISYESNCLWLFVHRVAPDLWIMSFSIMFSLTKPAHCFQQQKLATLEAFFLVIVNLEHWFLPFLFYFRVILEEPEIESWEKKRKKSIVKFWTHLNGALITGPVVGLIQFKFCIDLHLKW